MTDETKHTSGPWWIEERGDVISIIGPRENCSHNGRRPAWELAKIDNYVFWDEPETEAEDRANARLIVVAPEMLDALEACQLLLVDLEAQLQTRFATLGLVNSTIAKALGRSK